MNYVKHFSINGIDTKQVACIELNGRPNAATEGAVGVLGMDMSSPTHEVYKCVAVNGSIYTWELLGTGMSILSATITGEGAASMSFPYTSIRIPDNFLMKVGDLILDSEGYLYQVSAIGADACVATFCETNFGGGSGGQDYRFNIVKGKLQLVTLSGAVVDEEDALVPDNITIARDPTTGVAYVKGIKTVNDTNVTFFFGTEAEYNALPNKANVIPYFTDDTTKADLAEVRKQVSEILDGTRSVPNAVDAEWAKVATNAGWSDHATMDDEGNVIHETYVKKSDALKRITLMDIPVNRYGGTLSNNFMANCQFATGWHYKKAICMSGVLDIIDPFTGLNAYVAFTVAFQRTVIEDDSDFYKGYAGAINQIGNLSGGEILRTAFFNAELWQAKILFKGLQVMDYKQGIMEGVTSVSKVVLLTIYYE